ncbi:TOMM precursor leader peptide-binding protein [Paenibacillus dendritiformis]|uniref:TOMM precursor leader peptide-binding protein n=1 Tax=Paenibacillus dendritiformis TaxID=130049 RepID=UPI0036603C95
MSTVVIIGEGMLAEMVCRRLSGFSAARRSDFSEGIPEDAKLVLVVQEQDSSDLHLEADAALRPIGIPWLCAYVFLGEGVVGPLMRPGTTGCFQCAETRLSLAGSNRKEVEEMLMKLVTPDYVPDFTAEISPAGFRYMAHIIAAETANVLRGGSANSEGHIYLINFSNLSSSLHYILPNGTCPVCGNLPDDSPEAAEITLRPSLKLHNSYRCRSMSELREIVFPDYWDSRTGILNDKKFDLVSSFAGAVVNLPLGYYDEVTGGRSHSYADSQLAAILEGLERFCGTTPRGKRTVVFDSYSRLKDTAMDPSKAGFHSKEQFELPDFAFTPFDPEAPMEWVWGYSFLQERPILVPHLLAYYSLGYGGGFVYETSNGCAVGGSLEEAILYGIFEVVERDSFLMTWYARLPVPRLDPDSSGDRELSMMIHRLRAVTGYEVLLYNTTMENGIPSLWAIAKGGTEHRVNLVCAAGAHLDPVRAAKSAIHELAGMIPMTEERWRKRKLEAESMFEDSFQVQQMEDHALLYSLPQAEERLQFLLDERRPVRTFAEEFPSVPAHKDLTDDLQQVLQMFRSLQMDVIVVDQSSSETLRNGLRCVKVLIPGMLPMTFGHHLRRLEGLDRVLEVPMKLGYADRRLTPQEVNPYPHPFP